MKVKGASKAKVMKSAGAAKKVGGDSRVSHKGQPTKYGSFGKGGKSAC